MVAIKLRDDVVLVEQEIETHGVLIIPGAKKMQRGKVLAVGPGKRLDNGRVREMCVNINDRVIFGEWSGQKAELDGKEYLIILEQDIIGVLDDE